MKKAIVFYETVAFYLNVLFLFERKSWVKEKTRLFSTTVLIFYIASAGTSIDANVK